MSIDIGTIVKFLAQGGSVAVIGLLLLAILALLRRWVRVPDPDAVPREMYVAMLAAKEREMADWKDIVKGYGEAFRRAVDILETMEPRTVLRERRRG